MTESDIYANVDEILNYPTIFQEKSPKVSEAVYANEDTFQSLEINTAGPISGSPGLKKRLCRVAVCLGLLCAFLLTGLIYLIFQYIQHKSDVVLLQNSHINLTIERDRLQSSYNNLATEKSQLQSSYNNLATEKSQLQNSYNNLAREKSQLQNSYNNLATEKSQLQNSYNSLAEEQHQIQNRLVEVTKEKNDLQSKIQEGLQGWMYFNGSFYYISSLTKSWQDSRADCLQRGADLIIINSKEEQNFTRSFKKPLWIGLTDEESEGTWKWVYGTPLTTSYWNSGEPNGVRSENCAEIISSDLEGNWSDAPCGDGRFWICEKTFVL